MNDLETSVCQIVTQSIGEAVKARLAQGYGDAPLNKLVDAVVVSRQAELRALIEQSVDGALTGDFRQEIKGAVTHKLARVLVSKMEGEVEKAANALRASPELRARMTLAVEKCIKDFHP